MFDFDATLPLMAVQFLLLTAILNVVFFKPLSKAIEERVITSAKTKRMLRSV